MEEPKLDENRPEPPDKNRLRLSEIRDILLMLAIGILLFFALTVFLKFSEINSALQDNMAAQNGMLTLERRLAYRIGEVENLGASVKSALEEKIQNISDRRTPAGRADVKAPFPLETVMKAIVEIVCIDNKDKNTYYTASGTVIDKGGLIITNRHVLVSDDGTLIKYCGVGFTTDLKKPPAVDYIAAVAAVHQGTDLALLKIAERVDKRPLPKEFPAISLTGSSDASVALKLGDPVFIGGYPDIGADTFTFTEGVVSGRVGGDYVKTSALIDSGASGGGGFDSDGQYIGVPTAAAKGEIGGSLGYLIGADVVAGFMNEYEAGKK